MLPSAGSISKTVRSLCGAVSFCVTKGYVCGDRCYVIAMARTAPQQSDGFADGGVYECLWNHARSTPPIGQNVLPLDGLSLGSLGGGTPRMAPCPPPR